MTSKSRKRNAAAKQTFDGMLFEVCVNACVRWIMQLEKKPENWLVEARRDKSTTPTKGRSTTIGTSLAPRHSEPGGCSICSPPLSMARKGRRKKECPRPEGL